jgi:phosphoribosylanthranilate isomerase
LPPFVVPVGVFADVPQNDIRDIIEQTHIGCVQLHGNETPRQCTQYRVPVIKTFRVDGAFRPGILQRYTVSAFLLDTKMSGLLGGTGKTFDWAKAVNAKKYGPIILAGGLTPQNIIQAVEIVQPYAVDVNSGIEEYPGKKDHAKLKLLFQQLSLVREVTTTAKHSISNISERTRHLSRIKESGT